MFEVFDKPVPGWLILGLMLAVGGFAVAAELTKDSRSGYISCDEYRETVSPPELMETAARRVVEAFDHGQGLVGRTGTVVRCDLVPFFESAQ